MRKVRPTRVGPASQQPPLTHVPLASKVPRSVGTSTRHRRRGSWSPRVRRLLATPPKLGVYGDDPTSIMRGRVHGQDGPPAARGLSRAPGWEGVPWRPPGARGHGQDIHQVSVCFTSLLDHLDTQSLQQRDTSLLYLGMSTANRSLHDTPHSADVLAPRHRIPEEVTLHAKVTVGIRRKLRQRGPSPTPAAPRQRASQAWNGVSVPRSVGYVPGPGHPRSKSSWQRRAPCGAFGDGKDLESPMTPPFTKHCRRTHSSLQGTP